VLDPVQAIDLCPPGRRRLELCAERPGLVELVLRRKLVRGPHPLTRVALEGGPALAAPERAAGELSALPEETRLERVLEVLRSRLRYPYAPDEQRALRVREELAARERGGREDLSEALATGVGNCRHFAALFQALATAAGLAS